MSATRKLVVALDPVALAGASPAKDSHPLAPYTDSAALGGGDGMCFTSSPRWKSYDCGVCHVGASGVVSFELTSEPPELFTEPGAEYQIRVRLLDEHYPHKTNVNTFPMELDADALEPVGRYGGKGLQLPGGGETRSSTAWSLVGRRLATIGSSGGSRPTPARGLSRRTSRASMEMARVMPGTRTRI